MLLSSVALADPTPPTKEQVKEAEPHFFKGVDFFNEQDFPNAVLEFKKAYEIAPDFHVLFNVGQACYQAQNYACALDAFGRYLDDGGTKVPVKRRADVEKDIKKLEARVGKIELGVNVAGATVTVDDEKVGVTPLEKPILMSQGKRKIVVTKEGFDPLTETLDVAGGEQNKHVDLALKETPKAPPPIVIQGKSTSKSPLPYIALGVTGALAVGAVITGIVAISASSDADAKLNTFGSNPRDIKSAEDQASTFALVTDILGGAAIVGAGVTVVLFVISNKKEKEPAPKAARIVPLIGPASIGIGGTF